jgi:hypothetical protein
MPDISDNVDRFTPHPTYALAFMLPDRARVDRLLAVVGEDVAEDVVELLHGAEGLRILDQRGQRHGRSAWLHRLLQQWTYYEQILIRFNERLTRGDFLVIIPCPPEQRHRFASAAAAHGAHDVYYFGFNTVETITHV